MGMMFKSWPPELWGFAVGVVLFIGWRLAVWAGNDFPVAPLGVVGASGIIGGSLIIGGTVAGGTWVVMGVRNGLLLTALLLLPLLACSADLPAGQVEAEEPEYATMEIVHSLVATIVKLHDRIAFLEARQYQQMDSHTHSNDHYHSFTDSIVDPGYHSHREYAENDHGHWGYADEFHNHDRY